jgi:hypothetical protein
VFDASASYNFVSTFTYIDRSQVCAVLNQGTYPGGGRCEDESTHVIGKDDAVVGVEFVRVDPRVGNEDDGALAGDTLERERLEEDLLAPVVLDEDGSRDALQLVPLEAHPEHRLTVGLGLERHHRFLQVRRLPHLAPAPIACEPPPFISHRIQSRGKRLYIWKRKLWPRYPNFGKQRFLFDSRRNPIGISTRHKSLLSQSILNDCIDFSFLS